MLPHPESTRTKLLMLVLFAFVWGLLYGGILNLYFWPYVAGESLSAAGSPDSVGEIAANYGAFYLATSFIWDIFRALGNVVLILIIGIPAVKALSRFRDRFQFVVQ
jgi:energy-coupling factor transport system substrate-specific component